MAKKWVRIVRFCIEKEKMGVKAMIFIDRIAPREGYQAEWRGVKKGKWSSIASKRTFADEKYSSRVMREGTKKILLRQESLQKQKFFYKKKLFPGVFNEVNVVLKKRREEPKNFRYFSELQQKNYNKLHCFHSIMYDIVLWKRKETMHTVSKM